METPFHVRGKFKGAIGDSALATKFARNLRGDVLFDPFSRGRYSTDASIYQIEPIGVVIPQNNSDLFVALEIARNEGLPVLPRGGGTSQCGQTVGEAIIIDTSKHLNNLISLDVKKQIAWVEPGLVLDKLNAILKPYGLWFPVDVSTGNRATIGGMAGNNSCGSRSIHYGTMRDNVQSIEVVLADGRKMTFGAIATNQDLGSLNEDEVVLIETLLQIGKREKTTINDRFPDLMRRVGGYNIDALLPDGVPICAWNKSTLFEPERYPNLAHLLVGSEGTLGFSSRIELKLKPIPHQKVLGVCHFPSFYKAMASTKKIVELEPSAVELVDNTMIQLARAVPLFKKTVDAFVKGDPDALLLVEFSDKGKKEQLEKLENLNEVMTNLGFENSVINAIAPSFQKEIWDVRKSGLNIMMSMKGDGKPISFIEDCAVRLEDLAEYTARLTEIFHKNNTEGTWYAHASVGCLHVRPIINLKKDVGRKQMRDIVDSALELVHEYKGSHSGEHGDGLVRSEFHERMFGSKMVEIFNNVKTTLDPEFRMNPGKIVNPPKMDDPSLFRYKPNYSGIDLESGLDWSEWGGFINATEMCNNNGACRKMKSGTMCPSFRATKNERDVTRGRSNSLRLALSGQLGKDALTSREMWDTMQLCVSCKGCKRECPTGIDMAKMKIEFLHQYYKKNRRRFFDILISFLPYYAPFISYLRWLPNIYSKIWGMSEMIEIIIGISAKRKLPVWNKPFSINNIEQKLPFKINPRKVVLIADTFSIYFEPENLVSAVRVLNAVGYVSILLKQVMEVDHYVVEEHFCTVAI